MSKIIYFVLFLIGIGLLIFSGIGLFNTNLDSRVWLLISASFVSGILLTISILGLAIRNDDDKAA